MKQHLCATGRNLVLSFLLVHTAMLQPSVIPWTRSYSVDVQKLGQTHDCNHKSLVITKTNIHPYTQLIFSWNGPRPKSGQYTFWGQVRDAKTGKWHAWHRMADWGVGVQKSHCSIRPKGSSFCYVRLEAPRKSKGNG